MKVVGWFFSETLLDSGRQKKVQNRVTGSMLSRGTNTRPRVGVEDRVQVMPVFIEGTVQRDVSRPAEGQGQGEPYLRPLRHHDDDRNTSAFRAIGRGSRAAPDRSSVCKSRSSHVLWNNGRWRGARGPAHVRVRIHR